MQGAVVTPLPVRCCDGSGGFHDCPFNKVSARPGLWLMGHGPCHSLTRWQLKELCLQEVQGAAARPHGKGGSSGAGV